MADSGAPNPYDITKIVDTLAQSKASVAETLATQQTQFAAIQAQMDAGMVETKAAIEDFRTQVNTALHNVPAAPEDVNIERTVIDIEGIVAPMRDTLDAQLSNMKNAYKSQAQVQAKQLDAAVGAGAFGGNSYRAQQVYQSSMNQLFNDTSAQIATVALNAEQTILSTVAELSSAQAQIDFSTLSQEAQLNVEQDIRHREMQSSREVALLDQLGKVAEMTVEASAVLTNNWINLFNVNNQSVNALIGQMANLDITEAGVRQQLARDVFSAEMQMITNNMQLRQAYVNASAVRYAADRQASASRRATRAQTYVAELNADTQIRIAQMGASTQQNIANIESQSAASLVNMLGLNQSNSAQAYADRISEAREAGLFNPEFIYG